ncbi:hypothetical protein GCM10011581_43620 [Saccharopolyspora subtropica]|uniref:EF-hand domain-containing protein n=1 Tax=Saccharopolyspora thermophila TaxID=89367 RepID=A0A917K6E1_9PSEU|nr:EF-hand domain-containing protein [Saccharopolyspora subtropica]GGJ01723.1 hypothetical protein GCM10011581_43620 [Saccharopolyspora subtropica]
MADEEATTHEFDPRTFFAASDVDANGVLDRNEITALLLRLLNELDRRGDAADAVLTASEIEQTVEHLMQQLDEDGDGHITFSEFVDGISRWGLSTSRPVRED